MVVGEPPVWVLKSWNCTFDLNKTTTFGKEDSDCLIPFRSVSKHHAVINWDPKKGLYRIKEAPFSLGTFVNDNRIGGRSIVLNLGDSIRFGADSPTFRIEVKEKERDYISPRKTLSTVHDMEQVSDEDWPESTSHQTIHSSSPFVSTPTITPIKPTKIDVPAPKITSSEPPDLRDRRSSYDSPIMRADLSSRSSQEDRSRTSTPNSISRQNSAVSDRLEHRIHRNKGPKGSALYGQPTWWGESETPLSPHEQPPRSPRRSASTEYDPFEHGYERHDWVASSRNDLRPERTERDHRNGYPTHRSNGTAPNGYIERWSAGSDKIFDDERSEKSCERYSERSHRIDNRRRSISPTHTDDRRSHRSANSPSSRRSPPNVSRSPPTESRSPPTRVNERVYTPPPSKPAMAFQITFDDPKPVAPRGKKKKSSPPKSVESDRSRSKLSDHSDNKLSDHSSDRSSARSRCSDKSTASNRSCSKEDTRIEDIELHESEAVSSVPSDVMSPVSDPGENAPSEISSGSIQPKEDPPIKRELTQWANGILRKRDYVPVFCIHSALQDGRTLPQLIHCIADEKVSDLNKDPKMRIEILPNIVKCLKFSSANNLISGELSAADIVRGNEHIITILLEQLRAADKRKQERPEVPAVTKDREVESQFSWPLSTNHSPMWPLHSPTSSLDWDITTKWIKQFISETELTDDESIQPFRRHKTLAAPPRTKRASPNNSNEEGDKVLKNEPLQIMLLQTLNDLTQQLRAKVDKTAVYSLHIKEELDSLSGQNTPDDLIPSIFDTPPQPGSENSSLPDSEITQALKNLRFVEKKLGEIEDNLVHVRNESIPSLPKKESGEKKKKKKGLSSLWKTKDGDVKKTGSTLTINTDSNVKENEIDPIVQMQTTIT